MSTSTLSIPQKQLKQLLTIPRSSRNAVHPNPVIRLSDSGISCSHYTSDGATFVTRSWGNPVSRSKQAVSVTEADLRAVRSRLQGAEPEVWVDGNELCIETSVAKWSIRLLPNEEIPADSPRVRQSHTHVFTATECQLLSSVVDNDPYRPALQWAVADQEHGVWWTTDSYTAVTVTTEHQTHVPVKVDGMAVPRHHLRYHTKRGCSVSFEYSPTTNPESNRQQTGVETRSLDNENQVVTTVAECKRKASSLLPTFPTIFNIAEVGRPAKNAEGGAAAVKRADLLAAALGCPAEQIGVTPQPHPSQPHRITLSGIQQIASTPLYSAEVECAPPPTYSLGLSRDRFLALLRHAHTDEVLLGWGASESKGLIFESGQLVAVLMPIRIAQ